MLRQNVRLCVLLFILSIAVPFGDCQSNNCDGKSVEPGSTPTHLTFGESILKRLQGLLPRNAINLNSIGGNGKRVSFGDAIQPFADQFRAIFPGTRWCGDGDRARDDSDLGFFEKTDACCRAHDKCQSDIPAGGILLNLKNNGIFTRSACVCDNEFYDCLKNANRLLSREIGKTYFDILQPQCYVCECPTDGCDAINSPTACKGQCSRYKWVNNRKY